MKRFLPLPNTALQVLAERSGESQSSPDIDSGDDCPAPSILRQYEYSLLRICLYQLLGTAGLIAFLAALFFLS